MWELLVFVSIFKYMVSFYDRGRLGGKYWCVDNFVFIILCNFFNKFML